jgi:hypothetical protein
MIAEGADVILQARLKGMRPAEMILVAMVPPMKTTNHVVKVQTGHDYAYDWRWVHGLDICLVVDDSVDWASTLKDIAKHRPDYLCVWHMTGKWGAKAYLIPSAEDLKYPPQQWQYEIDFLAWLDYQNADFDSGKSYENSFAPWN